jgi:hypothetical protein
MVPGPVGGDELWVGALSAMRLVERAALLLVFSLILFAGDDVAPGQPAVQVDVAATGGAEG